MTSSYDFFTWPSERDEGRLLDYKELTSLLQKFDEQGDFDLARYFRSRFSSERLLSIATSSNGKDYLGVASGFISSEPFSLELCLEVDVFFVLPALRSKGMGRALFDQLLGHARRRDAKFAFVTHTKELLSTYNSLGMQEFSVRSFSRINSEC